MQAILLSLLFAKRFRPHDVEASFPKANQPGNVHRIYIVSRATQTHIICFVSLTKTNPNDGYLSPASMFVAIELPKEAERALAVASD